VSFFKRPIRLEQARNCGDESESQVHLNVTSISYWVKVRITGLLDVPEHQLAGLSSNRRLIRPAGQQTIGNKFESKLDSTKTKETSKRDSAGGSVKQWCERHFQASCL